MFKYKKKLIFLLNIIIINLISNNEETTYNQEKKYEELLLERSKEITAQIQKKISDINEFTDTDFTSHNDFFRLTDNIFGNEETYRPFQQYPEIKEELYKNIIKIYFSVNTDYKLASIYNSYYTESIIQKIINRNRDDYSKNILESLSEIMTNEEKTQFLKRFESGSPHITLNKIKKNGKILTYVLGSISAGYLLCSFISNFLQNISNNLMQPYFNRLTKQTTFKSKLTFEIIENYNLSDIGGYSELKKKFLKISEELKEQKIKPTKMEGLCLYGEPGNGKTQLVKALAGEAKVPLLIINLNTLLNENGQIEENINILFEEVRKKKPVILLIDEMDLIVGSRKNGKLSESEKSILNELLQQLDGTRSLEGVLVIGNTNVLDNIDFALQRQGRLGRVIEVPAPNIKDIKEIIILYVKKNNIIMTEEAINIMVEKFESSNKINVSIIKNTIIKIANHMKKNNIKQLNKNNIELIFNAVN